MGFLSPETGEGFHDDEDLKLSDREILEVMAVARRRSHLYEVERRVQHAARPAQSVVGRLPPGTGFLPPETGAPNPA
jgi:hypothetical protein